ncbi:MAG: cation transporter [Erysipelotrichaceae bacterium]|nr:cation transporter [Erysipelotrichaceae bacterium]
MVESNTKRDQSIVRISWISILINFILAAFKLFAGFMANSVAIITDGMNNVSDVMSSTITIFGT